MSLSKVHGIDVVRAFEQYNESGHISSTTQFITSDVADLYTMIPRNGALEALMRFCEKHAINGRVENLTVDTVVRLARVVLDTNSFVYKDKYYRQIKGGAMGSPFTMVLANIHMHEWEQKLIQHQKSHNELFGRYIDDMIMTSSLAIEKINELLEEVGQQDPHIQITSTIRQSIEFLNVSIENNNGKLKTSVYHKSSAEPYILPYLSDHPRHNLRCKSIRTNVEVYCN